MSSSDKARPLRVGEEARIASIEIRWPSGIQQVLKAIATDQFLQVDEPH
jgi:hypothetical protein